MVQRNFVNSGIKENIAMCYRSVIVLYIHCHINNT